ncbi:MAG: sarcosine oxidase subunit delta [Gammaproteobacteria bacterium]
MQIKCPYCGVRDHHEFTYGGDASRVRPSLDDDNLVRWYEYVFLRKNPRGRHQEYWQHSNGCRQWLRVDRDTVTHEIYAIHPAAEARST